MPRQTKEAKEITKKVYEIIRYSDPVSNDALSAIESQITVRFKEFENAISKHKTVISNKERKDNNNDAIEEMLLLLRKQNALLTSPNQLFPIEYFDNPIDASFEDGKFYMSPNYDEMLTQIYGDYMTLPPKEKRGSTYFSPIRVLFHGILFPNQRLILETKQTNSFNVRSS